MHKATDRAAQAFAAEIRTARQKRSSRRKAALAMFVVCGALLTTAIAKPRPLLVWNASPSAPIGLYAVTAPHDLSAGEMVIARVPARWRGMAALRRYIPPDVPLVKRVAAAPGAEVCARGKRILVDGTMVAIRQRVDPHGRALPWWHGCDRLRDGRVFLLMESSTSFDGRYFGLTERSDILGRATPLWVR